MDPTRTKLTPSEVAKAWGVSPDKILNWIRSGELRAINVASNRSGRPRYRIDVNDLKDFENRREVFSSPKPPPRRQRSPRDDDVIEFF